jgi:hypothetical protein
MIRNIKNLDDMWETMDTYYERTVKYITEALRLVI